MLHENYLKVLYIDLPAQKVRVARREDLYPYLGGAGAATVLLSETINCSKGAFDPGQPIVFAIGPLSTIFPAVTKAVAMFRSPLTGNLGESHAGGRIALALRYAGYDALVITGRAAQPMYLYIDSNEVRFKPAQTLWGLGAEETGRLLRDIEPGRGHRSIMRIGPAGENLVRYANVNIETYRHFGRLGLGATFGAKKLKGIYISGDADVAIRNFPEYNRVYAQVYKRVTETSLMEKYHDLGTPENVLPLNALGALPTRNFQEGQFEAAEAISGEAFAQNDLMRKLSCSGCPLGCIHIALLRHQFGKGYEFESSFVGYDYELIYALGAFLGIGDRAGILHLIHRLDDQGLDAIATGVTLGWATEAVQKGLISSGELGAKLAFGEVEGYLRAIDVIATGRSELARALAEGAQAAAGRYGGQEFAAFLGGNAAAGYHTGYANLVGQMIGARHSHLDNAGYAIDQKAGELSDEEIVQGLIREEEERCVLTSLCICLFARKVYDRPTIRAALKSIGIAVTDADLDRLGQDIYRRKVRIKKRCGFDYSSLRAPRRLLETPSMRGALTAERLDGLVRLFNRELEKMEVPGGAA